MYFCFVTFTFCQLKKWQNYIPGRWNAQFDQTTGAKNRNSASPCGPLILGWRAEIASYRVGIAHSKDYNHYPLLQRILHSRSVYVWLLPTRASFHSNQRLPSTNPAGPPGLLSCKGMGGTCQLLTFLLTHCSWRAALPALENWTQKTKSALAWCSKLQWERNLLLTVLS